MFMYWLLREGGEKCVLSQLEFWAGGGGDGGLEGYVLREIKTAVKDVQSSL